MEIKREHKIGAGVAALLLWWAAPIVAPGSPTIPAVATEMSGEQPMVEINLPPSPVGSPSATATPTSASPSASSASPSSGTPTPSATPSIVTSTTAQPSTVSSVHPENVSGSAQPDPDQPPAEPPSNESQSTQTKDSSTSSRRGTTPSASQKEAPTTGSSGTSPGPSSSQSTSSKPTATQTSSVPSTSTPPSDPIEEPGRLPTARITECTYSAASRSMYVAATVSNPDQYYTYLYFTIGNREPDNVWFSSATTFNYAKTYFNVDEAVGCTATTEVF